jgi:hypothetical protein
MKKMYVLLVFAMVLGLVSCKKDKTDPAACSQLWSVAVITEINALSVAAAAYSADQNHETCVAYKNAYQDYIDALEPFLDCASYTPQQKADLQAALDDAQDDIATLCDE